MAGVVAVAGVASVARGILGRSYQCGSAAHNTLPDRREYLPEMSSLGGLAQSFWDGKLEQH